MENDPFKPLPRPGFGVNHFKAQGVNGEGVRFADCEDAYSRTNAVSDAVTESSEGDVNELIENEQSTYPRRFYRINEE